ncbi:MAG: carbamoyltransferase N-terminal domain-containing protein [Verrucomicrobiota bacterium]
MKFVLGLSCLFHDAAACLITSSGLIVAAAQEERFTRVKHTAKFPINAINYCFEEAGIDEEDISINLGFS